MLPSGEICALKSFLKLRNDFKIEGLDTDTPYVKSKNGMMVKGFVSVCKHLARQADARELLGGTCETAASVDQWLEYRATQIDRCLDKKDRQHKVLSDLNCYLEDKVFLAGSDLTLADILVYFGLHSIMRDLTFLEKQIYINVSRWFGLVQSWPGLEGRLDMVTFQRCLIYSTLTQH